MMINFISNDGIYQISCKLITFIYWFYAFQNCFKNAKISNKIINFAWILENPFVKNDIYHYLYYRVEKQNLQVVKLVDSEHVNENMVQNSIPTCKHNLFTLIQSKKMFVECPGMWESLKRLRESELPCANLK